MQWGFDVSSDNIRLGYGSEQWYDDDTPIGETIPREPGRYYAKGDVLWHVHQNNVSRITGSVKEHYAVEDDGLVAVSKDALYMCVGKECKRAYNHTYEPYKTFPTAPHQIIYSEAGILYRTANGIYTPEESFLCRELSYYTTHEGVFVGITSWGMKIWFTASWQQHHRIALPGKAVDVACTVPWVCVVTLKNTCSIWNVHTGEAYRQWSLHRPRAVSIDHAAQVTVFTNDEICFFDDVGTCMYAQKKTARSVISSNDSIWLLDDDVQRMRPVDTWPLQVCMWCETPLSRPFPAPPPYVTHGVEWILDALKPFWYTRSFVNLTAEIGAKHCSDFAQIVDMEQWSDDFFEYAGSVAWTRETARQTRCYLLSDMNVDVDVHKWANVSQRHPDDHAFELWDVLFVRLDDDAVDVIELACEHEHDAWLSRRAEECALYVVHPYLISFLHLDTFLTIMERHWGEWVPVFLDWIQTTQNITSRRMWRRFLRHLAHHGPIEWYPQALRVMDMVATWRVGDHDPSCAEQEHLYCFDPSFQPTRPIIEDVLLDTPDVARHNIDVLLTIATPLLKTIYDWQFRMDNCQGIVVTQHEEMFIWTEDTLYRRNNNTCTATTISQRAPIDVDVMDDSIVVVHNQAITVYKLGVIDVVYRFPRRDILFARYECRERMWILSSHGVLECIHAVNGRTIYRENILFLGPRCVRRDGQQLIITCSECIYVYDTRNRHLEQTIHAANVYSVCSISGRLVIVYEDNMICYEGCADAICTTDYRPLHVQAVDEHVIVLTTVKCSVYDSDWELVHDILFDTVVADFCNVGHVWYVLLRNGVTHALQWSRSHLRRVQGILFDAERTELQRNATNVINTLMQDTTLYDDMKYVDVVSCLMEDRTIWPHLLREDVCRWLMHVFFRHPNETWTPLWTLFSFRGTTIKCSICQSATVSDEEPLCLLKCGHRFHARCIARLRASHNSRNEQLAREYALQANLTCPLCRTPLSEAYNDREMTLLARYDSDEEAEGVI